MPVRDVIEIDEALCDGCGDCVSACAEGAIAVVGGKARLVSEVYCDGLGACLGECPRGAIQIVKRDSADFDPAAVERHLEAQRPAQPVVTPLSLGAPPLHAHAGGCPGSRAQAFAPAVPVANAATEEPSQLRHWPVQLHQVPPTAPFFADADVLLAADCVAYAVGGFHSRFLAGRSLAIACPKLDSHQEVYLEKLRAMVEQGGIRSLTVMVMEVPCCGGLVRLVQQAVAGARRQVPVSCVVVGVRGDVLAEHRVA
jgi:Pyruvate/2-oxoacid:ferredoxin oxidoreductase delta subunit